MVLPDWMIERDVKIEPFTKTQQSKGVISFGLSSYGYDARVGYKFRIATDTYTTIIDPKNFNEKAFVDVDLTPIQHSWSRALKTSYKCRACGKLANGDGSPRPFEPTASESCPKGNHPLNYVDIPPNSFALAESFEKFTIPRDCLAISLGKSSYARCGILVNITPLEPEWSGIITIEISNTTRLPARIYAGEGICQIIFLRTDGHSEAILDAVRQLCGQTLQDSMSHSIDDEEFTRCLKFIEKRLHEQLSRGTCRVSYADKHGRYMDQTGITLPFVEKE